MKQSQINFEIENKFWMQGIKFIAGVDEAGRGPLAGPVVAAAVIFSTNVSIIGVDDSKKLSASWRDSLFKIIMEKALSVGIGIIDNITIDRINILQATNLAMQKALENLQIIPEIAIVDGNSFKHETLPFQNIIDGDAKSFSIACASIIAKVTRDRIMYELDKQFPLYGFAKHKGYGTEQHIEAIRTYGPCEIHRKSFHVAKLECDNS